VEALCQLFNTVGKQLEENPKSRTIIDSYFARMEQLTKNERLVSRMRFMVRDVLELRTNKWVPRREEVGFLLFSCIIIGNERLSSGKAFQHYGLLFPILVPLTGYPFAIDF